MGDATDTADKRTFTSDLYRLLRNNWRVIISALCAIIFISLALNVLQGEIMKLDQTAYWLIVQRMRRPWLTPIMTAFSSLATPAVLICSLLLIAAFAPGRRPATACAVNLGCVLVINVILKAIVQRPRPDGFRLAIESGFSFPSGHSMVAMGFFGLIVWLIIRSDKDRNTRLRLAGVFSFLILMIGVSRIYLGVHYASDVIAGFCVSLIWLAVYTRVAMPLFMNKAAGKTTSKERLTSDTTPCKE